MKQTRINKINCPTCDSLIDGVTGISHYRTPKGGDLTVCIYCGEFLAFSKKGDDFSFNVLSDDDFIDLPLQVRNDMKSARLAIRTATRAYRDEKQANKSEVRKHETNNMVKRGAVLKASLPVIEALHEAMTTEELIKEFDGVGARESALIVLLTCVSSLCDHENLDQFAIDCGPDGYFRWMSNNHREEINRMVRESQNES